MLEITSSTSKICLASSITRDCSSLVLAEAKQILDVEDVISSILLVEDLRIQKN